MRPARSFALLASVAAAAVLAASCGESNRAAATVDGTEISQQEVVDELEAIRDNGVYLSALESQLQSPVLGSAEDSFDAAFVAEVLTRQIQFTIVGNEVDRRELEADGACREAVRADLVDRLSAASPDGDGQGVFDAFPTGYRDQLLQWDTDVRLLQSDLAGVSCIDEDAVETFFEANPERFEQVCLSHVLLATPEEAEAVQAELAGGADFAAVAQARSIDTQSAPQGGDLGCVLTGQLQGAADLAAALEAIDPGQITGPVQTDAGFSIFLLRSRETPDLTEVRDSVEQAVADEAATAFRAWLSTAFDEVDVVVDPRYGVWDPVAGAVERNPSTSATLPPAPEATTSSVPADG